MAEPDLIIEAGFSDAKLAAETQKVLQKYKQMGEAAEKAFRDASGSVADNQALRAHLRELDRLQRAYDPVYTAAQKYEAAVKRLDRALELGAIDQAKYTAEVKRAQVELGRVSGAVQQAATGSRIAGHQFQNVGYQVQDFAVQVASGTDASRAFAQQFPQLASAFGVWGVAVGTVAAVLVPLAASLLGTSAKARTLEEELSDLEKTTAAAASAAEAAAVPVEQLSAKYGDLADEVHRAAQAMAIITSASAEQAAFDAARRLGGDFRDRLSLPNMGAYLDPAGNVMPGYESAREKLVEQAIQRLGETAGATAEQAERLAVAIGNIGRSGNIADVLADGEALLSILAEIEPTTKAQQAAIESMASEIAAVIEASKSLVADGLSEQEKAVARLYDTYDRAMRQQKQLVQDLADAEAARADALRAGNAEQVADMDRIIAAIQDALADTDGWAAAMAAVRAEIASIASVLSSIGGGMVARAGYAAGEAILDAGGTAAAAELARRREAEKAALRQRASTADGYMPSWAQDLEIQELEQQWAEEDAYLARLEAARKTEREAAKRSAGGGRKSSGGGRGSRTEPGLFESIEREKLNLEREITLIGKSAAEVAKARAEWAMLDEAKKRGIAVSDELRGKIEAEAQKLGELTQQQQHLQAVSDSVRSSLQNAFQGVFDDPKEALKDLAKQLAMLALQMQLVRSFPGTFGSGGIIPLLPGRASGGTVMAGQPYMVGERGPEPFVPAVSGRILSVPQAQAALRGGGGGTSIQIIDQRSASAPPVETETTRGPDGREIVRMIVADDLARGRYDKTMGGRYGAKPQRRIR
ncbi:hypothetical protein SAMN05444389_101444 [Paracoccus solventivorans]|uniref:Prophage tail length tape measure protein n=1 Tax=Paracoccus solventivorans TaxID=53463 RepID=A0A1M7DMG8_9RHOB|nr:hypothetical protein [Paracoccus solventivorans]SHL80672.1 hypothetical protein SAMN05444389_101444 [Paracoccus solventivorans]